MSDEFINFCRQMSGLRVFVFYCLEATYTNLRSPDIRANWFSTLLCLETTFSNSLSLKIPYFPASKKRCPRTPGYLLKIISNFCFNSCVDAATSPVEKTADVNDTESTLQSKIILILFLLMPPIAVIGM